MTERKWLYRVTHRFPAGAWLDSLPQPCDLSCTLALRQARVALGTCTLCKPCDGQLEAGVVIRLSSDSPRYDDREGGDARLS